MLKLLCALLLCFSLHASAAAPALPQVFIDTTYTAPSGNTITVNAGGSVQTAINAAQPGDTIVLQAGATFTGNFSLPAKTGSSWIVIRTSTPDAQLPAAGTRVLPADAAKLAKLQTSQDMAVIYTSGAAHHYRLIGLEITVAAGVAQCSGIVSLGNSETSAAALPNNIIIDRCYIHGNTTGNMQNGIRLNCATAAIIDSYIDHCQATTFESHCIGGYNGPGPFKIVNNYLGGSTINVIFGGAVPKISGLVPSDIEFRRNYVTRPSTWMGNVSAGYVKNLFELKNGQRVLIDGNIFEHNWPHPAASAPDGSAQHGFAMLFTVRDESGGAPSNTVSDITITHNIVRRSNCGISFYGREGVGAHRFKVENNLFDDIGLNWGNNDRSGMLAQIDSVDNITFNHNTVINDGDIIFGTGNPAQAGFVFTNNIIYHGCARSTNKNYGINGAGTNPGNVTLNNWFPSAVCTKNVFVNAVSYSSSYPAGNYFPADWAAVGFTDLSARNYQLTSSSAYSLQASDGKDIGVDLAALTTAQNQGALSAPAISSVTATPNPAETGQALRFLAAAVDPNNDTLTYTWDFGDGTTGSGSSLIHLYSAAGTYAVSVAVSDGSTTVNGSVSVVVTVAASATPVDSDGDGVSDVQELLDGTDPLDANSALKLPLTVLKLGGMVKFGAGGGDSCSVSGVVPGLPAGFSPAGVSALVDIGGAQLSFTLDAKGRSRAANGSLQLRFKFVRNKTTKALEFLGGDVPFKAKLMRGSWTATWADEGVDPAADKTALEMNVGVNLRLGTALHGTTARTLFSSKAGKGGKFKK